MSKYHKNKENQFQQNNINYEASEGGDDVNNISEIN